ncbi:MAG TPA: DNA polymerase IV [Thermoplasmata archaeon]|nr:DNA polymerase IV [Thermoplasmata archaeon]
MHSPQSPSLQAGIPNAGREMRWVFYVDMDAFYVSCELRDRPDLKGRPVIVGPDPSQGPTRGVVLSASYEARKFGVRSALPAAQAARLCPDAVWVPADFAKYERLSTDVMERLRRFSPDARPHSIDEAAFSVELESPVEVERLARTVQEDVRRSLDLPCTVGVAPSRLVAKIATDTAKPAGVRVVGPDSVAAFLAPLPVRAVPGIGPKTEERLAAAGIHQIGDVATAPRSAVSSAVGGWAEELRRLAQGKSEDPVESEGGPRSRSVERTFSEDVGTWEGLEPRIRELAESLADALAHERWRYQTVTVAVRWADFGRVQRSRTLPSAREGRGDLAGTAARLARELWGLEQSGHRRPVRMVSVGAERLVPARLRSIPLDHFDARRGIVK